LLVVNGSLGAELRLISMLADRTWLQSLIHSYLAGKWTGIKLFINRKYVNTLTYITQHMYLSLHILLSTLNFPPNLWLPLVTVISLFYTIHRKDQN
jgi:hypothetical protein